MINIKIVRGKYKLNPELIFYKGPRGQSYSSNKMRNESSREGKACKRTRSQVSLGEEEKRSTAQDTRGMISYSTGMRNFLQPSPPQGSSKETTERHLGHRYNTRSNDQKGPSIP